MFACLLGPKLSFKDSGVKYQNFMVYATMKLDYTQRIMQLLRLVGIVCHPK